MKKIISFTLILSIIFSYLTFPVNKANATMVTDLGNIFQSTISAISNVAQEALDLSDNYKEMVLDPMVNGLAKMIVQQITASIVQWINSGFEGSPSFMQDPGSFFLDIADQATGRFITGDILKSMCSPFSINIKLALLLTYRPRTLKRYTCTIGTIIKNSKNAIKNASINGFTAGDFKQGGWPAFVSLTTEPQNNIYGSYLQAKYDLAVQIADQKDKKNDEINRGRGFLSWRDPKCKKEIAAAKKIEAQNNSAVYDPKTDTYINNPSGSISSTGGEVTSKASMSPDDCPIQTPGSVIAGALDKQLGSGTDQLNLADEFGEIVNALFAQLVSVVIGGSGLGGSSQRNSSGNSYISTMNEDLGRGATELNGQKKSLIDAVKLSKTKTIIYRNFREEAFQVVANVIKEYNSVKSCYSEKINANPNTLTQAQISVAQSRIGEVTSILSDEINTTAAKLLDLVKDADERLNKLKDIESTASSSTSLIDISTPISNYNSMLQSGELINTINTNNAEADLTNIKTIYEGKSSDAKRKLQTCQIFPAGIY